MNWRKQLQKRLDQEDDLTQEEFEDKITKLLDNFLEEHKRKGLLIIF